MEVPLELDDAFAPGVRTGDPGGVPRRFRSRPGEPRHLSRREERRETFGQRALIARLVPRQQAIRKRPLDGRNHCRMAVAEERRPERGLEVEEALAVDVGQPGALADSMNNGRPSEAWMRAAAETPPGRWRLAVSNSRSRLGRGRGVGTGHRWRFLVSTRDRSTSRKRYPAVMDTKRTPRIAVGGFMHEAHTFVPGSTTLESIRRDWYVAEGDVILSPTIGDDHEVSGGIDVATAAGAELVPTLHAYAGVGPPLEASAYRFFEERILAGLRANRGRIDGVFLPLHGACVTTESEDPEGDLLTAIRAEVGPNVPIAASFDLHCHTTDRMVAAGDALVAYSTCPHTDHYETGQRAMRLLLDAVAGRTRPVTRHRKLRLMAAAEKHDTNHGPMVGVMELAREMETRPGVLSVSVTATQPWLDLAELGWSAVVVADGDPSWPRPLPTSWPGRCGTGVRRIGSTRCR